MSYVVRWTEKPVWGGEHGVGTVPGGLWEVAEPLIPPAGMRPQGGGSPDTPDETLSAAIIHVMVSDCSCRALPPCFGMPKHGPHRRFLIWSRAGVRGHLHRAVLHRPDNAGPLDVARVGRSESEPHAPTGGGTSTCSPECGRRGMGRLSPEPPEHAR
ncbi:hypothetical protein SRIMM317S_06915 [Streptomyces rimosus subsp. rimosus]